MRVGDLVWVNGRPRLTSTCGRLWLVIGRHPHCDGYYIRSLATGTERLLSARSLTPASPQALPQSARNNLEGANQ